MRAKLSDIDILDQFSKKDTISCQDSNRHLQSIQWAKYQLAIRGHQSFPSLAMNNVLLILRLQSMNNLREQYPKVFPLRSFWTSIVLSSMTRSQLCCDLIPQIWKKKGLSSLNHQPRKKHKHKHMRKKRGGGFLPPQFPPYHFEDLKSQTLKDPVTEGSR